MKSHVKIYMEFFDYGEQDFIPCECCGTRAVDIHHIIYKSRLGKDIIENIIALCRYCHDLAHNENITKEQLKLVHENYITRFAKDKP